MSKSAPILISLIVLVTALHSAALAATGPSLDARLERSVVRKLLYDGGPHADEVRVRVRGRVASLSGTVDTLLVKTRSVALAKTVKGVINTIDLMKLRAIKRSDSDIEDEIKTSLSVDPATAPWPIEVASIDGIVTLAGHVDSPTQKTLAGISAAGVAGVHRIDNEVLVVKPSSRKDTEIKTDITQRLVWDPWLEDRNVGVLVTNGKVRLTGTVTSKFERRRLAKLADVEAVKAIENRTTISNSTDAETLASTT